MRCTAQARPGSRRWRKPAGLGVHLCPQVAPPSPPRHCLPANAAGPDPRARCKSSTCCRIMRPAAAPGQGQRARKLRFLRACWAGVTWAIGPIPASAGLVELGSAGGVAAHHPAASHDYSWLSRCGNVLSCRCDTRSPLASELADWRADYVGSVVPGACSTPGPPCRAPLVIAACGAQGKARGLRVPSGSHRRGADRTGESREPSLMPREAWPRRWDVAAGCRDWPLGSGRRCPGTASGQGEHRRPRGRGGTHNAIVLRADGKPDEATLRLLHAHCHRHYTRSSKNPALLPASPPICRSPAARPATVPLPTGPAISARS